MTITYHFIVTNCNAKSYGDKLQKEIDLLVGQRIIAPVTEPTKWCAPIVVTPNKNSDGIRMCADLSIAPFRPLLNSRNDFMWTEIHDLLFRMRKKKALTAAPNLAYFDLGKETRLHTDASTTGIGFVLLQRATGSEGERKTVQAGSE